MRNVRFDRRYWELLSLLNAANDNSPKELREQVTAELFQCYGLEPSDIENLRAENDP